jgi:RNase P protein component
MNFLSLASLPRSAAVDDGRKTELPSGPQVAFAIGRPFGNAVERNRGRRRLREAFLASWRSASPDRQQALDGAFLLSGSRSLLSAPFARLVEDVNGCLSKLESQGAHLPDRGADR